MTRRIAISILLTVWLVLILAGALAYGVTRSMLIADLDASVLARVASLPQIERPSAVTSAVADARDRFLIQNENGQFARPSLHPGNNAPEVPPPEIVAAAFSRLADGQPIRTLTVKAFAKRTAPSHDLLPVTVVYSAPADRLEALLTRLLVSLGAFGLLAGILTAAIAVAVAKNALKPLRSTADVIAAIGEHSLDKRIAVHQLPPELAPVALRLNELLARLETASHQRNQFLADASHELRTPVAALLTTLEVALKKERAAPDYAHALQVCLTDARLLHQLVAALLDQVKSQPLPHAHREPAPVNLSRILLHSAAMAQTLADHRSIRLTASIPENITALTDELAVRSIVTNLLYNAVEYTPSAGQITLTLNLLPLPNPAQLPLPAALPATPHTLEIIVHDTGPGIPPQHLPHLFEPFYRADPARTDAGHHLGLGLFQVKNYATSLGGNCTAASPPGQGATFTVRWPALVLNPEPATASPVPASSNTLQEIANG